MGMRRKTNNLTEQVVLFVGSSKLITINNNHQIVFVNRTIILNQKVIFTYQNSLSNLSDTKLQALSRNKNPPISLENLNQHEHEYKISLSLRPHLLLYRKDGKGVNAYLQQLKIFVQKEEMNIVAIVNTEENVMNGFVFNKQHDAIDFYEAFNQSIATQIYAQTLKVSSLSFNYNISNMLGSTMNGSCIIDPNDFQDGKQQQSQIQLVLQILNLLGKQILHNFRTNLFEMSLKFKIVDENSRQYACKFINKLSHRIQVLYLNDCELDSDIVGKMMTGQNLNISQMISLQQLHLCKNNLTDDVLNSIGNLFKKSNMLHTLNLSSNLLTLEKQSIFAAFLNSIVNYKLNLNLSSNKIQTSKYIIKYLMNADGTLPISQLDLSHNPFISHELISLTKLYHNKCKSKAGFQLKMLLSQLQFEQPHAFQCLAEEYWFKKPKTMSIPIAISKHPIRKNGIQIGSTAEELDNFAKIDQKIKNYIVETYKGNFCKMKKIKDQLKQLHYDQQLFDVQTKKSQEYRKQQQNMILRKLDNCLNFKIAPSDILTQINQSFRFVIRKGLVGQGINCLALVKSKIQQLIDKWSQNNDLGLPFRQIFYRGKHRYINNYEKSKSQDSVININYHKVIQMDQKQLLKTITQMQNSQNIQQFLAYCYLQLQTKPDKFNINLIQCCMTDPRLSAARVLRLQNTNSIQFQQSQRIYKSSLPNLPKMVIASNYGIQTYKFGKAFIESGSSSSGFPGLLSPSKMEIDQQKTITAFIEVINNFMNYLYYTPEELSDQTLMYLSYIVQYLMRLQTQAQNDLKNLLAEELVIHMITYFDSSKHKPLANGYLLFICQFITRRVQFQQELQLRLVTYLIKQESITQNQLTLHSSDHSSIGEGKIDWHVKQISVLKQLILKRGKMTVQIADITHPKLFITVQIDELDTVLDLWAKIKQLKSQVQQKLNVLSKNLDYYWLCGQKQQNTGKFLKMLPSYQHIGKLILVDNINRKFYLRKVAYSAQLHSMSYLKKLNYQQLISIYSQSKQSFKESAFAFLGDEYQQLINSLIIQEIWTDSLLQQQIMLINQRRQLDQDDGKYRSERDKIVNQCISQLYNRYVPIHVSLDESGRLSIITQIKVRQMNAIAKNINDVAREAMIKFIQTYGIASYSIAIVDQNQKYLFFANNRQFVFVDNSQKKSIFVRSLFRNLIWFQIKTGQQPCLKFDVIQESNQKQIVIHKFTICGQNLWLSQCFVVFNQICKIKINYPVQLLFQNQDSQNGFSAVNVGSVTNINFDAPILDLTKYFTFKRSRKIVQSVKQKIIKKQPQKLQKSVELDSLPPLTKIYKNQNQPAPISQLPQIRKSLQSKIPDKNIEIEQIMQAANKQQEEDVIISRKSFVKKDGTKRRSRNR